MLPAVLAILHWLRIIFFLVWQ